MGEKSVVGEEDLVARCTMLRERLREFLTWGSFNCTFDDSDGILLWNCGVQFLDGRNSQFLKLLLWKLDCINLCCIATFRSFFTLWTFNFERQKRPRAEFVYFLNFALRVRVRPEKVRDIV